jgi:phosphatidylserine/phosphatidylglycerophosphate/cardiolipin synthase-like enzyme
MLRNPALDVTIVLHVDARPPLVGNRTTAAFAKEFWSAKWPWPPRPKVYFDPRGTAENPMDRALQHSKCIVADLETVFITSANYTESGQLRNIELGVLVRDEVLAARVVGQFRSLIAKRLLVPLPS